MSDHPLNRLSGVAPFLMSLAVLAMIVHHVGKYGLHAPHHDEAGADHVAMLLMYGQFPIMMFFLASGWRELKRRLPVFAAQAALWVLAVSSAALT
jgi:hypothetical protein